MSRIRTYIAPGTKRPAATPVAPGHRNKLSGANRGGNRPPLRRPESHTPQRAPAPAKNSKAISHDDLKFIPLGGFEEIGRNCSYFEYKDEIVVVDVGIQFPEEDTPGIDFIIPNVASLEPKKKNIRGIILTHGHYDHIAAIHYVIEKLGNPIIYTTAFTKAIVEKRHEEFTNAPKLRFQVIKDGDKVRISENFSAEFIRIEHTIPESCGFILDTPVGKMVSFGDFRLETSKDGEPQRLEVFEKLGKMDIHSAFIDSTNAEFAGFSMSEKIVEDNLEALIKNAPGRIIIATFASLVDRLIEIIKISDKLGKVVAVNGRSMISNLEIAKQLGYLPGRKDHLIPLEEVRKHRDDKVVILTTGTQGEQNAGLMRISRGEHRVISLKPTDTVVFSSSVVPGNERSVQTLQDNISRQVDEVHNSKLLDIHASGHIYGDDAKLVLSLVKPKFVVPIHGYYYKRKAYKKIAKASGMDPKNVIMLDNGQVSVLTKDAFIPTEERVPASYVMVDGLGVGDVEEVVLRDRINLSEEGMVVIIVAMGATYGKLLKNPDILSRGFIYLKEHAAMIEELRKRIRGMFARLPQDQEVDPEYVKTLLRDQIGQFLYTKTKRRPMILPVVILI
jgi:ribonuclease J